MNLAPAQKLAEKIAAILSPFCDRAEVAGSIRRRRAWVNDIDLVLLPRPGQEEALRERCKVAAAVVREGPQQMVLKLANGEQLDLWFARPESNSLFETVPTNFGTLLLCRTGSKEHNIFLVEQAKRLDLIWKPHEGVFRGLELLASASEEEIFEVLHLPFVRPEDRER